MMGGRLFALEQILREGENKIRPTITGKRFVRTGLSFELPTKPKQRRKKTLGFDRWPLAHAAIGMEILFGIVGVTTQNR